MNEIIIVNNFEMIWKMAIKARENLCPECQNGRNIDMIFSLSVLSYLYVTKKMSYLWIKSILLLPSQH